MMRARSARGSISLEFGAGAVFLTIFTVVSIYVGLFIFGATLNDRACRDACRAAAQGKSLAEADKLARAALVTHNTTNGIIVGPRLESVDYQDFGGTPPADESPFVTVTTSADANLPFASPEFFGAKLDTGAVIFRQTYTFPIVKVR